MTFAERLKITRKKCKLTQKEVAKALDITEGAYCSYEKGKREPNLEKLVKLAKLFDVSTDFLLNVNKYNKDVELNQIEKDLLTIFKNLNDQGQKYILQTIDIAKNSYLIENSTSNQTKEDKESIVDSNDEYITEVAARGNSELQVKIKKSDVLADLKKPMSTGFDD